MSYQEYSCKEHGRFTVQQRITDDVPATQPCPEVLGQMGYHEVEDITCGKESPWQPSLPACIIVQGGTT